MSFHSPHLLWLLAPLVLLFSWELARHTARAVANWPKIARAWAGAFDVSLGTRHTTAETRRPDRAVAGRAADRGQAAAHAPGVDRARAKARTGRARGRQGRDAARRKDKARR